jgi:hypothetical protein
MVLLPEVAFLGRAQCHLMPTSTIRRRYGAEARRILPARLFCMFLECEVIKV